MMLEGTGGSIWSNLLLRQGLSEQGALGQDRALVRNNAILSEDEFLPVIVY